MRSSNSNRLAERNHPNRTLELYNRLRPFSCTNKKHDFLSFGCHDGWSTRAAAESWVKLSELEPGAKKIDMFWKTTWSVQPGGTLDLEGPFGSERNLRISLQKHDELEVNQTDLERLFSVEAMYRHNLMESSYLRRLLYCPGYSDCRALKPLAGLFALILGFPTKSELQQGTRQSSLFSFTNPHCFPSNRLHHCPRPLAPSAPTGLPPGAWSPRNLWEKSWSCGVCQNVSVDHASHFDRFFVVRHRSNLPPNPYCLVVWIFKVHENHICILDDDQL